MAIYHLSAKVFSRAKGHSAVGAAAYRAAEKLVDERIGKTFDYSRRDKVLHTEIRLPEVSPSWAADRATLWNKVEATEKRKDAQLNREVEVALPRELNFSQQKKLVSDFVDHCFTPEGMVADIALHESTARDSEPNPHAHILLTLRPIEGEEFGKKNRQWNQSSTLEQWRKDWQSFTNDALDSEGSSSRIDHRSLEDQGLDREPTIHLGKEATALEKMGVQSMRGNIEREIKHRNRLLAYAKSSVAWLAEKPMIIYQRIKQQIREPELEKGLQR